MVAFLRIVGQLGAKAASWAWANKGKVLDWIKNGMAIDWIINKINDMVN
ncbi:MULTISPECIES: aureocin A53 family class IId bacteriocin [Bacillus]|uniref:Bacteriocin aureocin A53 n=2 Tax=Bacillus cereus group TaxID=86661 RepID=A0A9X8IW34_BACCE|nr:MULTISPECIES: aureocin A53 family class IId bacteriocin [Bacillus]ANC22955.1 bacteriocin aureocin A53 [Bacillus cereus]KAA0804581.1 bacteriocin aureocin A53 [Bacillus sp. AY2-1]MCU4986662.1 aureocin A53 family class IId bacteriocin [Bacillus cereus]MDA2480290.1 aureocin A53 family class IId bacteriocin [Bacillus cereus]MDA2497289.1 aureocin A53 family class IId bacteriocin [Bacillus cereus]